MALLGDPWSSLIPFWKQTSSVYEHSDTTDTSKQATKVFGISSINDGMGVFEHPKKQTQVTSHD
jgi:hypothetical protein